MLAVIAFRAITLMGLRLGLMGVVLPASIILTLTLLAAIQTRLQGMLITAVGIACFVVAMLLMPRVKGLPAPLQTAATPAAGTTAA